MANRISKINKKAAAFAAALVLMFAAFTGLTAYAMWNARVDSPNNTVRLGEAFEVRVQDGSAAFDGVTLNGPYSEYSSPIQVITNSVSPQNITLEIDGVKIWDGDANVPANDVTGEFSYTVEDLFLQTAPYPQSGEPVYGAEKKLEDGLSLGGGLVTNALPLKKLLKVGIGGGSENTDLFGKTVTFDITVDVLPPEEVETKIVNGGFENGDLTGWTVVSGTAFGETAIEDSDTTFWAENRDFHAEGEYFLNGYNFDESAVGVIRSTDFTLGGGGYISLLMGGSGQTANVYIAVCDSTTGEELAKVAGDHFSDPALSLNMVGKYLDLSQQLGRELYIKIVDNASGGPFGSITADSIEVSLTAAELRTIAKRRIEAAEALPANGVNNAIKAYYANYNYPVELYPSIVGTPAANLAVGGTATGIDKEHFDVQAYFENDSGLDVVYEGVWTADITKIVAPGGSETTTGFNDVDITAPGVYTVHYTVEAGEDAYNGTFAITVTDPHNYNVLNGGFETGDLTGWTINFTSNPDDPSTAVVNDYEFWAERLPFNKSGDYLFSGGLRGPDFGNFGKGLNENAQFTLKSSAFTLGGSGWISFKLAGNNARVRVYDAENDNLLAQYNNTAFADISFPNISAGCRLATMTTFAADLSEHIGKELYVVLIDDRSADWGVAIFDDLITYYETAPAYQTNTDPVVWGVGQQNYNIPWELAVNTEIPAPPPNSSGAILELKFDEADAKRVADSSPENAAPRYADIAYNTESAAYTSAEKLPYRSTRSTVSGGALAFDGVYNSIGFPWSQVQTSGNKLTIDVFVAPRNFLWSDPNADKSSWYTHIICGQYGADSGFKLGMMKYGYYTFQVFVEGKGWRRVFSDSSKPGGLLDTYAWNHITAVFDGTAGTLKLYRDGVLNAEIGDAGGSIRPAESAPFLVGRGNIKADNGVSEYDMSHYNGLMDELIVYSTAKTAQEISEYHGEFTGADGLPAVFYDDARLQGVYSKDDYYRPEYHAMPPAHWMNEPHALFKFNGMWHLFYQANSLGSFWQGGITWGHWASRDMVNWAYVADAVVPMEGTEVRDGAWSGNVAFNADGQPVLVVTAGNDARRDVSGKTLPSNQNVLLAYAVDYGDPYLTDWIVAESLSVEQTASGMGVPGEFRDAQVFSEDGVWYMTVCGRTTEQKPMMLLFTTENGDFYTEGLNGKRDYNVWTYRGDIMPDEFHTVYETKFGKSAELPSLSPIYSENKLTKKYILSFCPSPNDDNIDISAYYWLGSFNKATYEFMPDHVNPKLMDHCYKAFSGATLYFDAASKMTYAVGIIQDDRVTMETKKSGWAHLASMVRELFLKSDGTLGIRPAADYDALIDSGKTGFERSNATVSEINGLLDGLDGDNLRIRFRLRQNSAGAFGFDLKKDAPNDYVRLVYDDGRVGILKEGYTPDMYVRAANTVNTYGDLSLDGGILEGEIYIDRACVEIFLNDGFSVSTMIYNKGNSLSLFGDGITVEYFRVDYLTAMDTGLPA